MINALKLVTIQRGYDPRDLTLIVSGGAGPMVAACLGRQLHVVKIVIPLHPGIFSAWGMLAARPRVDLRQIIYLKAAQTSLTEIDLLFATLEKAAAVDRGRSDRARFDFKHMVEMRYTGQEQPVPYKPESMLEEFMTLFKTAHLRAFSFCVPEAKAELTRYVCRLKRWRRFCDQRKFRILKRIPRSQAIRIFRRRSRMATLPRLPEGNTADRSGIRRTRVNRRTTATTLILLEQTFQRDRTGQLIVIDRRNSSRS